MQSENLERLARFDEARIINNDLGDMYKLLEKEFKKEQKPDSLVGRLITDSFGVLALYFLLFLLCDFTRAALTNGPYFGFKWLIWGPYYFFTKAPLMTRVWKSKKFLEDLSNFEANQVEWPNTRTCTAMGSSYSTGCNNAETHHNRPVRDHLGKGLDWILSHIFGDSIGKFINNSTCDQQGTTIGHMCAADRVKAAYDCYSFWCSVNDIDHVATQNHPNEPGAFDDQTRDWDTKSKESYRKYYEVYTAIYDLGSVALGNDHVPVNLNPDYDSYNNYCFNPANLFGGIVGISSPPWWYVNEGYTKGPCYYQQNYVSHKLDYWDAV